MTRLCLILVLVFVASLSGCGSSNKLTIATVNNADMTPNSLRLSKHWEEKNGIPIEWVVLEENVLRQRVTDISTGGGQFDIITIGAYETPIWGKQGTILPLDDLGDDYDYDDLLEPVRNGLWHDGKLYAVPFYAESSFTYYRTDLFQKAGLTMPDRPTYTQVKEFAAKTHDPANKVYGICLRGKPGWGENGILSPPCYTLVGGGSQRYYPIDS